jgi:uncharacterized protein YlbG (UPF0298 family)
MAIPCVVIDLKTNKRYTIDQFAAELHNGLLKELVNESIIDNTKLKGRTELLNVSPKATEEVKVATKRVVEKAFNSVKNLIEKTTGKKAKLEYAKNREEMIALVKSHGGTEADATARGYYYGKDGTIVINEEFGTTDTGYHEPTHPIWDVLEAYNPEVLNKFVTSISKIKGGQEFIQSAKLGYPTLEGELPKLRELLEKAKADGKTEVVDKLQQRIDNINRDINQQKKEIVTDFFAKIADGTFKVDQTNYEMVRDYVLQTLKAIGIKLSEKNLAYLDQKALMDLVKVISDKFEKGEEITAQDLGLEKFELIGSEAKVMQKSEGKLNGEDATFIQFPEGLKIVDGFYSPLEKKVLELKGNKWGSGQQAWGELNKGLKADEVQATGIEEWLKSKTGGVTKQEIVDYVKNNRVELVEVEKGGDVGNFMKRVEDAEKKFGVSIEVDENPMDGSPDIQLSGEKLDKLSEEEIQELQDQVYDYVMAEAPETKYQDYQLEGGKNYKEILVTLPSKEVKIEPINKNDYSIIVDNESEWTGQRDVIILKNGVESGRRYGTRATNEEIINDHIKDSEILDFKNKKKESQFKSSHWDEPNIAVHLRMNTRTDAAGNKVAFVEEVQSDWGQEGKKKGFKEDNLKSITIKSNPKLNGMFEAFDKDGKKIPLNYNGESVVALKTEAQVREALAQSKPQGVASAPYVTNTKAWTKLGLKYALQNAVKEGAERLAWTTGEQQAGRYDLSKQVDSINYLSNGDGTYQVYAKKDGNIVFKEKALEENKLEPSFGKEVAEKIINDKGESKEGLATKVLSGEDLAVGGSGMKGFYGTAEGKVGILGNTAKELVKDLTGKEGKIVETDLGNGNVQQSIEITPELKAQVEKGMPQFSRSETINEPSTFTTRTGEKIGYTYDTDKVARERFDFSKLKRLGGGSDRDVFDLGDGKLLKVAKTARGLEQNIYEGDHYLSFVPEVYERGLNYVVAERAEAPLVSNKGGAELQAMLKELSQFTQQDFDKHNPKLVETLEKYGLEDAMSYDVLWNDFTAKRNWGLKDGQPIHVDGGTFGGVRMLDRYRGKTNLSDPEFRQIYNQSKDLKKQFGDTDKYKQFSKSEVGETVESTAKALEGKNLDNIKTKSIYRGIPNEEFDANIEKPLFFSSSKKVAQHFIDGYENAREEAIAAGYDIAPHKNIIKEAIVNSEKTAIYDNDVDVRVTPYEFLDKLNIDEKTKTEIRDYIDERFKNKDIKLEAWIYYNYADNPSFFNILKKNGYDVFEIFEKGDKAYAIIDRGILKTKAQSVAETYLKAKADGSNPELVKAVDEAIGKPQFSKSEIPNAPEEVSIKNAAIDEARAARGAEPVATQARQTWGEAWDKAVVKVNNGESAEVLAKDIARSPRSLNDVEHAMLFMNELDLNNKYWNLIDQINKGEGDIKNLETQLQDVKRKLEDNEYAIRASGTETARGLAIRRWSKKANYSAEALKAEARAANKGEELDVKTSEALENKAKEIQKAQEASDEYDAKMREKEEEKRMKEAEAAEKKAIKELEEKVAFKTATRDEINTYIDKRRNKLAELIAARDEAKGGIQRAKSEAPINYEELIQQEIKEIAKGYFSLGNMDMNSLVKAVYEDLQGLDPSFTERDVRDAISGYKGNKPRMTKPAIDVEMQDLKSQMKKMSEIEDYNKNNPSRVKKEPAPKSKALTDLENQLADKVKEQKLFEELEQLEKEGLPEPKTRTEKRQLSQDIQDLQEKIFEKRKELGLKAKIEEIEQGNLPEKGEPKKPLPPELQKLQDDLNNKTRLLKLSNELEQLESEGLPAPKTPKEKQQLSQEVADLEKKVADKKTELKGNDAKKKRLLELTNELESLEQNGLPAPKTPKAKAAVDQEIQDLKNQISEKQKELKLKGKIADIEQGNLPQKGQPKAPLSDELQALQDEYNKKKRLLEITKEFEEFRRYGSKDKPTTRKEVDADIKAIQDQLAEGKRIEALMKKSWELDRLDQDVNYLNQEIDRLRNTGENDVADILQQQLNDLIEANKKKPKESKPKTQKEIDLRNDIKKKEKELGIDGADEAKLKAAKTRMQNRINELQRMIDTRNFDKPEPKPVELDEEGFKLKAELERKKLEADKIIEEERRKNMTSYERGIDTFNKIQRAMVLSGVPVLFKLVTAGAARVFLAKPAEAVVGMAINKFIPKKIKDKLVTERYGDFWKTQAKATTEWFKKENWLGDEFMKIVKTGVGTYDEMFGDKKYGLEDSKFEFFGRLHAALKSPTKRAEWLRSYEKRYIKAAEMGEDVSNLDVQYRLGSEAYIDAMNSIFMGDNAISKSYTDWLNQLERGGNWSKLTGAFMRMLIPVVKIPTNYVLETAQYTPGVGLISKDMFNIVKNGFDNLTPEQADFLIKIAKRQGVGFAAFAVGAMNSDNIGGYYQRGEKRGRDDVKAMDIKIGGKEISHTFLHSPLFEIMQMGATWARIHKKAILDGKTEVQGYKEGGFEAITGLLGQIPQAPAIEDLGEAFKDDPSFENWVGSTANRMIVPQLMRNITSVAEEKTTEGDKVKREPRGFTEQMMKGTGLDTAPIRLADYIDVSLKKDYEGSVTVLSKIGALDDLSDINTKKFLIYDSKKGVYKPLYLDRVQVNQLNKLAREKFIQMIKDSPILSAKDPMEAYIAQGDSKEQEEFRKLSEDERAMPLKNLVANLWSQAKTEAKNEKGYIAYDENKITE